MKITQEHCEKIADTFPRQRGNVTIDNLTMLNAILYILEHGCKWRGLSSNFGNWHSICARMSRWRKSGALDRIFARLQQEQMTCLNADAFSLDSAVMKVHPDGTGALKKRSAVCRQILRRMDSKTSSDCRCRRMRGDFLSFSGTGRGCPGKPQAADEVGSGFGTLRDDHGQGL